MIVVIKNNSVLYSAQTVTRADGIVLADTLFGIEPKPVIEPQALVVEGIAHLVVFRADIPPYLHVLDEFKDASIFILDDFKYYGEKVRTYYHSFSKEELFQEVLKYRLQEVNNADACTLV